MDIPETSASTISVDNTGPRPMSKNHDLEARAAGRHNVLHLLLAALGVVMLGTAFLDWLIHPVTLWTAVP
jgi:hypothetical protein